MFPPNFIAESAKFTILINRGLSDHSGTITDEARKVRWQYGTRKPRAKRNFRNPFLKRDLVLSEIQSRSEITIRRLSFLPPAFGISDSDKQIGSIRLVSVLRNRYLISIEGMNSWTLRMPLFTTVFKGSSATGSEILIVMAPSERQWNVAVKRDIVCAPLIAALAFIHSERYFYG